MRVLLVASNRVCTPFPVYPLGVDYVASALSPHHDVRVVDLGGTDSDEPLLDELADFRPAVVGISVRNVDDADGDCATSFVDQIADLVRQIRSHSPAKILLGGAGFSLFPEALMARTGADLGMVGEGEWALDLLNALEVGRDVGGLTGVVLPNRPAPQPVPWPGPYTRRIGSEQVRAHYLRMGGMLNIQTKRGCPFRCSYCTYPLIEGRRLRLFDPQQVADEWMSLVEAGAKFLFVTDAVFNSHEEHNLNLAAALARRGATVPWGAFFAPTRPRPDYYRALRDAGLTHVEFGTESLSNPVLQGYGKPFSVADALAAHEAARKAGLHVAHYIMLGGPGEDVASTRALLDECERLEGVSALFFFCGVRIYPSTGLHRIACEENQIAGADPLLRPRFYQSGKISAAQVSDLVRERAKGRRNWVLGSGNAMMIAMMKRLYARGAIGPLWERLGG